MENAKTEKEGKKQDLEEKEEKKQKYKIMRNKT